MKKSNNASVILTVITVSFYGFLKLSGVGGYQAAFTTFTLMILALAAYQYVWRREVFPAGGWRYLPLIGCWSAALSLVLGYPVYVAILLACAGFVAFFAILLRHRPDLSINAAAGPRPGPWWRCGQSFENLSPYARSKLLLELAFPTVSM